MSKGIKELLILGIGSPFGADRAGWDAIEILRRLDVPANARLEIADRPGAGLLALLQGVDGAILIDALLCDHPPGTLHRLDRASLARGMRHSNHSFGVVDALALAQVLGSLPRHVAVLGISVHGETPPSLDPVALLSMVHALAQEMGFEAR